MTKCTFCKPDVKFLGFRLSQNGYEPTPERKKFLQELQPPKTISGMRSVVGVFGCYRLFKKGAAAALAPLNNVLKGHTKKRDRTPITWTPELTAAFDRAKALFADFAMMQYPREGATLILSADASDAAVGAVLEQLGENGEREPLGFFSTKLNETQRRWSTYDRELYALYAAVDHFENLVEGRRLILVTDHKPLIHVFSTQAHFKIQRRSRQAQYLSQFTTEIVHVSGINNVVADALSRLEIHALNVSAPVAEPTFDFTMESLADAQASDTELQSMAENGHRDHTLSKLPIPGVANKTVLCSTYQDAHRPIVPVKLRCKVFNKLHQAAHPGLKSTQRLIGTRYFWPNMKADIRKWHRVCADCQKNKITRHSKAPVSTFPPSDRFEHIHLDIVVLKPTPDGHRYLCTFIDRATRWLEAIPLRNITAEIIARTFVENWVARYGVPAYLTTDRGAQFTSALFAQVAAMLGSQQLKTTAYNPRANGAVERVHRRLKDALRCRGAGANWTRILPAVLLGLRSAARDDTAVSCAEMTFGKALRLPGEIFSNSEEVQNTYEYVNELRNCFRKVRPAPFRQKKGERIFVHPDLATCRRVYVRVDRVKAPLESPYTGPHTVLKRTPKWYKVDVDGKSDTINVGRLKPAYELADDSPPVSKPTPTASGTFIIKEYDANRVSEETHKNTRLNRRTVYVKKAQQPSELPPNLSPEPPPSPEISWYQVPLPFTSPESSPEILPSTSQTRSGRAVKRPVRFTFN